MIHNQFYINIIMVKQLHYQKMMNYITLLISINVSLTFFIFSIAYNTWMLDLNGFSTKLIRVINHVALHDFFIDQFFCLLQCQILLSSCKNTIQNTMNSCIEKFHQAWWWNNKICKEIIENRFSKLW